MATSPASSDHPNEDFAVATPKGLVLLDGAGLSGTTSGCKHGVAWYTQRLGTAILAGIAGGGQTLQQVLGMAIAETADLHRHTCDLNDPGTPSATVVIVRFEAEKVDYLVLADSVLLLQFRSGTPEVITDNRESLIGQRYRPEMDALPNGTPGHDDARRRYVEALRAHRNRPDGFWVAAADSDAAEQAITGTRPVSSIAELALLSDGATRLVDRFALASWQDLLASLRTAGPADVISRVREAELSDSKGDRWPRGKTHDDATVLYAADLSR
ncbi:protein phosphatase 2C domain-containing protein [Virgisporangium aliadipatigenens]|nr:protein phosphatase 2C domain-containing protein [Virgisporangium aliadipatigenens]